MSHFAESFVVDCLIMNYENVATLFRSAGFNVNSGQIEYISGFKFDFNIDFQYVNRSTFFVISIKNISETIKIPKTRIDVILGKGPSI